MESVNSAASRAEQYKPSHPVGSDPGYFPSTSVATEDTEKDASEVSCADFAPDSKKQKDGAKDPCCTSVGTTDAKEPTVSHGQGVEDTQDVATVGDGFVQAIVEGQPVQLLNVHMEPRDFDSSLPSHPRGEPFQPCPVQESEHGKEKRPDTSMLRGVHDKEAADNTALRAEQCKPSHRPDSDPDYSASTSVATRDAKKDVSSSEGEPDLPCPVQESEHGKEKRPDTSTLRGVRDKAPRGCGWQDICHLLDNGKDCFHLFAETLRWKRNEVCAVNSCRVQFSEEMTSNVKRNWKGAKWNARYDDERQVQPVIHSMLECAAHAAQSACSSREFIAVTDPSVVPKTEDRVADEAAVEVIPGIGMEWYGVMRILLEVKGTEVFPQTFMCKAAKKGFCQVIQEVALALASELWKKEIMCGLVTRDKWYLFRVVDMTAASGENIKLKIEEPTSFALDDSNFPMCVHFLWHHLCKPL